MPYPYSPFGLAPVPLPSGEDLFTVGPLPPVTPAPTPGSAMGPGIGAEAGPIRAMPGWHSLRAFGAGMMTPFGFAPPPTETVVSMATPTLAGTETEPRPTLVQGPDIGAVAAEDPAAAEIGRMVAMGPLFRGAGAVGRVIMSIPGVRPGLQALGGTLARPAVGVPLALGGSLAATSGEAQAPTALGARTTEAQTALDEARRRLRDLETRRTGLQTRIDRYDPENLAKLTEEQIKEAQTAVGATADGRIGDRTRAAIADYRRRLQAEIQSLGPSETTIRADIKTAEDRRAEAERLDLADSGRQALEESQPGTFQTLMPTVGSYVLGGAAGHGLRQWLARGTLRRAETLKREVDAMSAQLGQGDLPTRISRLNELWTQGRPPTPFNRGTAPPFAFTPSGSPSLHTPSPVAPWSSVTHEVAPGMMGGNMTRQVLPPDQLYRPGLGTLYGPTAATMGIGGAESAASQLLMLPRAQQALQEAQATLDSKGPTPENVDRLRRAEREVAFWTGMQNLGRGMALGGLGAEMMHPLRSLPRPSMAAAEAERGALDLALHPRAPPPVPPAPPPPAPLAPAPLPLAHQFQPRQGGRFSGPPVYPPGDPRRRP